MRQKVLTYMVFQLVLRPCLNACSIFTPGGSPLREGDEGWGGGGETLFRLNIFLTLSRL